MRRMHIWVIGSLVLLGLVFGVAACTNLGRDRESDTSTQIELSKHANVAPSDAITAATTAVPGAAQAWRLSRQGNTVTYEVIVKAQAGGQLTDVHIDATTGQVRTTEPANTRDGGEDDSGF